MSRVSPAGHAGGASDWTGASESAVVHDWSGGEVAARTALVKLGVNEMLSTEDSQLPRSCRAVAGCRGTGISGRDLAIRTN
jgi:hypothetical protein